MKLIQQSYKSGALRIFHVPFTKSKAGQVVIKTRASIVSIGTEKYMLEMGRKSLLGKALARPDQVRQVIAKAQAEGLLEAWRQAMGRLDSPVPLGYSSAGEVISVGESVEGFSVSDRVACTGAGYAGHTEVASVPANLCAKIPEDVHFESASFVALGGIALEAVRMADTSLGETIAVIGLGLLGQIAVQLLSASGCRVVGVDLSTEKAEMALQYGAVAAVSDYAAFAAAVNRISHGHGADATLIFAATSSNQPLEQAAEVCRERGRVVAAGLVGLEVPRTPFYDKELDFVVSRAWGPGLYDPDYAEKGVKYPVGYVRWTAQRNMEAFLDQVARGAVKLDHLITHRYPFEDALQAYEMILEGEEPYLGVLLTYDGQPDLSRTVFLDGKKGIREEGNKGRGTFRGTVGVGLVGAGLFANGTLLPAMKGLKDLDYRGVATSTGLSGRHTGDKFDFDYCTTDYQQILKDEAIDLVFILTRHGSHAKYVVEALRAGKHVFVEKPLALNLEQLQEIAEIYSQIAIHNSQFVMVGFNRRFSPFTQWIKSQMPGETEPLAVHCTVNAGQVPPEHWVHDPQQGGGRVIGEVCHFVDLIQYLTGSQVARVYAETMGSNGYKPSDNVTVTLKMTNNALGSITYVAGGDKRYPRERVEVIGGGAVGVIENFQAASITRGSRVKRKRNWLSVDRGHRGEIETLLAALKAGGPPPVPFEDYLNTTLATFALEQSLRSCQPVPVDLSVLNSDLQS